MSGKLFFQIVLLIIIAIVLGMGAKHLKHSVCKRVCPYPNKASFSK